MATRNPEAVGPKWFEDLPWRVGYRIRRFLFHIWGPPQLSDDRDPLKALARQRQARYSERAKRRADAGRA
jgi:hypothetical protein